MIEFPDIDPVAFSIGPLSIRWYALAYLAGFILGWKYALYLCGLDEGREMPEPAKAKEKKTTAKKATITKAAIDDFFPWGILGVILGGRLGYVLFYQTDMIWLAPADIIKIWHGGMSFHGGALGAVLAMLFYTRRKEMSFMRLTDLFACAAPIGLFFGRIANFVNGELFGRVTDMSWGVVFPHGGIFPRHPSQLYEAALEGLVLFIVLAVLAHRPAIRCRAGVLSGVFLTGYGLSRFIVEFFREPDAHIGYIAGYFTMGQILSLPMIAGGILLVLYAARAYNNPRNGRQEQKPA